MSKNYMGGTTYDLHYRDTYADSSRFLIEKFPVQTEMTKDDYVIICGDFGGVWTFEEESCKEKEALDWLNNKNLYNIICRWKS